MYDKKKGKYMKINSIARQNFCARPCNNTKNLLFQMEENRIDTKPITDVMNKIYVGSTLSTSISHNGQIKVDIYEKGDHIKSLIKRQDGLSVNAETFRLKNPKEFAKRFLAELINAANTRSHQEKIWDKVNSNLTDR